MATVNRDTSVPNPRYVLALLGAGLSVPSGLPTFAELSDWRNGEPYEAFASSAVFENNPVRSWLFHEYFRQRAMSAQPNQAHDALARYAQKNPDFRAITQNIDGKVCFRNVELVIHPSRARLSERAGHPPAQLAAIHGSLHFVRCCREDCPFVALATREGITPNFGPDDYRTGSQDQVKIPSCPECKQSLLRPAVIWKGELLAPGTFEQFEQWMTNAPRIDIMLVIGTSGGLSSHYIEDARMRGAVIVHFNIARMDDVIQDGDWFIVGDCEQTVPQYIKDFLGT